MKEIKNITMQSIASPRTPHLSMRFTMVNMSAKFEEEAHIIFVCIRFKAYFPTCPLWWTFDFWPPKSMESILSPRLTSLLSLMKKYTTV